MALVRFSVGIVPAGDVRAWLIDDPGDQGDGPPGTGAWWSSAQPVGDGDRVRQAPG